MSPDSNSLEQLDGEVASPPASPASWVGSLSAPTQLIRVVCPVSPSATGNNAHLEPLALQFTTATAARTAVTPSAATGAPSVPTVLQSSGSPSAPSPPPSCTAGPPSTDPGSPLAPTVQQSSGSPLAPSPPPPPPWSLCLPRNPYKVICWKCLNNDHWTKFRTCVDCRERW